ncbi:MAG: hypothetical protein IPJ85_01315 [Flavobacteriales bacterium]|nr:hypothetical protein [Flavobacteriales bacterium]
MGLRKLRINGFDGDAYSITHAMLDGSEITNSIVPKDAQRSFTSWSFTQGVLPIEPVTGSWDLCFTQYTHHFEDSLPPLSGERRAGRHHPRMARIATATSPRSRLRIRSASRSGRKRNTIGYDWKVYSFKTSSYTIVPDLAFIVKDADGYLYKMRFVEFYGPQGQTGCPLFETVPL